LLELGYELLMVDHVRPGILLEARAADAVQPEAVCDYLALARRPRRIAEEWTIEPPLTLEDTVLRLAVSAEDVAEGHRRYVADLLAEGPEWLRGDAGLRAARRALALDESPVVRAAFATRERPGPGAVHAGAAPPRSAEPVVLATGLSFSARPPELERAVGQPGGEPPLSGIDVRVVAGRLLAVRASDSAAASALLRVLAGLAAPLAGEVVADRRTLLVSGDGAGVEPSLSVEENLAVFGAFSGCDVGEILARAQELAEMAQLGDLDAPLAAAGPEGASRLMLAVALAHVRPRVLLVDGLAPLSEAFAAWAHTETRALLAGGAVVVQAGEPPLVPAGAMLDLGAAARAAA
jgi:ABC-type polysaccharide/polyol phosphate transport system ATPase subunit